MGTGAQYIYQHQFFKLGVHNFVFVHRCGEWIKSSLDWHEVKKGTSLDF
jgi:hypothetical protein